MIRLVLLLALAAFGAEQKKIAIVSSVLILGDSTEEKVALKSEIESYLSREIRSLGDVDAPAFSAHTRTDRKTFLIMVLCKPVLRRGDERYFSLTFIYSDYDTEVIGYIEQAYKVPRSISEELIHNTGMDGFDVRLVERDELKDAVQKAIAQYDTFTLEPYRQSLAARKK